MGKCYLVPVICPNKGCFYIWENSLEWQLNGEYKTVTEALHNIPDGYKTDDYNIETTL